jgi:phosphate/sulfate permease
MENFTLFKGEMMAYFAAEKTETLLFMIIGAAGITIGIFLFVSQNVYRGMVFPFVLIGLIQLIVGGAVFFRTDKQVADLETALHANAAQMKTAELARMDKVNQGFRLYKIIEIVLLAVGITMSFFFKENMMLYGVAVGLIIQSPLMLVADLIAEHRAEVYVAALQQLSV